MKQEKEWTFDFCEYCGGKYYDGFKHGWFDCIKHLKQTIDGLVDFNELYNDS